MNSQRFDRPADLPWEEADEPRKDLPWRVLVLAGVAVALVEAAALGAALAAVTATGRLMASPFRLPGPPAEDGRLLPGPPHRAPPGGSAADDRRLSA